MKKLIVFLVLINCYCVIGNENEPLTIEPKKIYPLIETKTSIVKTYPYVSQAVFMPGAGVSLREEDKNIAIDVDVHSLVILNTIAATYSKMHYFSDDDKRGYIEAGIGVIGLNSFNSGGVGPTFPVRIGLEADYGFVDLGIQAGIILMDSDKLQPWPLPELRMGFSF